jgi:hypothetical protein
MAIEVLFLSGLAIDHHACRTELKLNPLALPRKQVFISSTRNQHFKLDGRGRSAEIQIIPIRVFPEEGSVLTVLMPKTELSRV